VGPFTRTYVRKLLQRALTLYLILFLHPKMGKLLRRALTAHTILFIFCLHVQKNISF